MIRFYRRLNTGVKAKAPPSTKLACVSRGVTNSTRWKGSCVWLKMEMEGDTIPFKEVYKEIQKKAKQSAITLFFTRVSAFSAMRSTSFDYPDNLQL